MTSSLLDRLASVADADADAFVRDVARRDKVWGLWGEAVWAAFAGRRVDHGVGEADGVRTDPRSPHVLAAGG